MDYILAQLWRMSKDMKLENKHVVWKYSDRHWNIPPEGQEDHIEVQDTNEILTINDMASGKSDHRAKIPRSQIRVENKTLIFPGQLWRLVKDSDLNQTVIGHKMTGRLENANGKWKYSDETWTITSEEGKHRAGYISEIHTNKLLGLMGGETVLGTEVILQEHDQESDAIYYWFITKPNKDGWFRIMPLLRPRDVSLTAKNRQSLIIEGNMLRIHI